MRKQFLYLILLYFFACLSWGKYVWDNKIHRGDSILFKVIAIILLIVSFFYLIVLIFKLIEKKEQKNDNENLLDE